MTSSLWHRNYDEGVPATLHPYPDRTLIDYIREAATNWPDGRKITAPHVRLATAMEQQAADRRKSE